MITSEKLKIYIHYNGDIDLWTRIAKSKEDKIESTDWHLIDSLIQDITLVKNGLASEQFISNLKEHLLKSCDNEKTVKLLKSLSR
ncbi:hypothetical protein EHQ81_01295 [Leptospira selangorensis]|uniref:Uncharacterized protein n=1 Tax=Leptospira selangorensis TaxID=2484982 RepID=A0A5F2BW68_9LEPT|nr:hypothetical protein [Leptospira selangorensis]TGM12543.1 hypothetical protein EHQ82_20180 [Leptospira selangorensis]TGM16771.1 hypothetical protein EHQ81_01295 [Leptospira selangorensis]